MSFTAPITQAGQDAYDYLEPLWADDDQRGFPLKTLVGGLCEAWRYGEEVVRAQPGRDPWQQAWDINECPNYLIPFLGQGTGSPPTEGADPVTQRQQVRAEQNFYRGTVGNLLAAAAGAQTQPNRTTVQERSGSASGIAISYDPASTPDVAGYTSAVKAAVVWGLVPTVTSSTQPFFEQASAAKTFESVGSTVTFETATLSNIS